MSDGTDPAASDDELGALHVQIEAILRAVFNAHVAAQRCSVARLRKQLGMPLSGLMRTLSALADAELVALSPQGDVNADVALTDSGLAFGQAQFGAEPDRPV